MIKVIGIGKVKEKALKQLVDEYIKRIGAYHNIVAFEVKDEPIYENDTSENIKAKEANAVLKLIKEDEFVILLDLKGQEIDSLEFASKIENLFIATSRLTFVIAGSLGPGKELIKRANWLWKLSSLTFLHQMTKVLVLEQLYRAFKIINHEKYHK